MKRISGRTILLGLGLILITFSLFFALPSVVPSFKEVSCEKLILTCSHRGMEPVRYTTYIWDEYIFPEESIFSGSGKIRVEPVANSDDTVIVSGYLMYGEAIDIKVEGVWFSSFDWKGGLVNRRIYIKIRYYYEGKGVTRTEEYEVTTGGEGCFSFELQPHREAICYGITGVYPGEIIIPYRNNLPVETYHGSTGSFTSCPPLLLEELEKSRWWVWLIIGLIGISITAGIVWFVKHRKDYHQEKDTLSNIEEITVNRVSIKKQSDRGGNTAEVAIEFPEIEESLPTVWEANTTLFIHITFRDRHGNELPSQTGNVEFGDGDVIQSTTDEKGGILVKRVYEVKGDFTITAGYKDRTGREVSSWRRVRIVDYREEMVHLFGEMLKELNLVDITIGRDMTPREVERLLIDKLKGISAESIRQVIDGFEEANYSTHPVNRESYLRMYRAIQEITGIPQHRE